MQLRVSCRHARGSGSLSGRARVWVHRLELDRQLADGGDSLGEAPLGQPRVAPNGVSRERPLDHQPDPLPIKEQVKRPPGSPAITRRPPPSGVVQHWHHTRRRQPPVPIDMIGEKPLHLADAEPLDLHMVTVHPPAEMAQRHQRMRDARGRVAQLTQPRAVAVDERTTAPGFLRLPNMIRPPGQSHRLDPRAASRAAKLCQRHARRSTDVAAPAETSRSRHVAPRGPQRHHQTGLGPRLAGTLQRAV